MAASLDGGMRCDRVTKVEEAAQRERSKVNLSS